MHRAVPGWVRILGIGNVIVAVAWATIGWNQFRDVGTKSLMLIVSEGVASQMPAAPVARQTAPPPANPLGILTWSSPPPERTLERPGAIERPRPTSARPAPRAAGFHPEFAEIARQGWAGVTSALAGAILLAGLSLMFDAAARRFLRTVLWMGAVAAVVALVVVRHTAFASQHDWIGALIGITQSRRVWCGFAGIAVVVMAILGTFALRSSRRPGTWNSVAIAAMFGGTLATLAALSVLIRFAGFPPLPNWIYGAIAVGQSGWAWILLLAAPGLSRLSDSDPNSVEAEPLSALETSNAHHH